MSYDKYYQKDILDAIDAVSVTVSGGAATDVSGVESRIDTTNTKLDTVNTNLGTVNTSIGTGNTSLTTINTTLTSTVYGKYTGTVRTTNMTVSGTAPTKLPATALTNRRDILVMNYSSTTLWVGGSDVTAANGITVVSGTVFSVPLGSAEVYGITTTAGITTSNIRVMEIS